MRYLCLVYVVETEMAERARTDPAMAKLSEEAIAYDKGLLESGQLIMASPLKRVNTAATIRTRDGRMSVTDGPFAETKEQLGGFILIEARDLNEAIDIAGRAPIARYATLEVRPVGFPGWDEDEDEA